jgi:hypothetical protein
VTLRPNENQASLGKSGPRDARKAQIAEWDWCQKTRLSKNFILRDFLYSSEAAARGLSNLPEDPQMVVQAGKALCEKILEPVLARFGRFAITFGYQCREAIEADMPESARRANPRSSNPHQWDRQTWGDQIYARVDLWPFCVEDGQVSKHAFGHWIMHTLDVDLLMQFTRSNIYCVTISPKPRRVWIGWGNVKKGERRQTVFMGARYWQRTFPTLPKHERPKFAPSCTGGSMQWRDAR